MSRRKRSLGGSRPKPEPQFFCYGRSGGEHQPGVAYAFRRPGALWTVLKHRWMAETILVWHIHFLRLLPLFRLPAARVVLFLHGIEAWRRHDWLTNRLLRRVDLILSNSMYTWDRFLEFHPASSVKQHQVVNLGLGDPLAGATPSPLADRPVALMLGRMDRREAYKGHKEMIRAWRLVAERIPAAELWIVGGGNLLPDLEEEARDSVAHDRIRFFGRVSPEKKQELLGQCRCLALPSRGEGFGLVYLEAMRLGRPCLVSTEDAGREVVNPPEAGLSASPHDTEAIANATCRLLTPGQEWEQFANGARRRYESRFTGAQFQKRLLEALAAG